MNLERYRKDAKALVRAFRAGEEQAGARATAVLGPRAHERFGLSDAQHVIAVEHGYRTWPELRRAAAMAVPEPVVEPEAFGSAAALGRVDLLRRLDLLGRRDETPQAAGHVLDEALGFAALNGREDAVEWLLERGAKVDGAPDLGATPLHLAVQGGHAPAIRLLITHGADTSLRDGIQGETPAEWARRLDRPDLAGLIEGVDTGLEYTRGEPVRLRVEFRRFPYVLDGGRAVELAGRPEGWRAAAERVGRAQGVNVSRVGVVSLPVVAAGPGFDAIVEWIAEASLELYQELLELDAS